MSNDIKELEQAALAFDTNNKEHVMELVKRLEATSINQDKNKIEAASNAILGICKAIQNKETKEKKCKITKYSQNYSQHKEQTNVTNDTNESDLEWIIKLFLKKLKELSFKKEPYESDNGITFTLKDPNDCLDPRLLQIWISPYYKCVMHKLVEDTQATIISKQYDALPLVKDVLEFLDNEQILAIELIHGEDLALSMKF